MPARFEYGRHKSRQATFEGRVNSNIPLVVFMDKTQGLPNRRSEYLSIFSQSMRLFRLDRADWLPTNAWQLEHFQAQP
jgi:hypothetical protein